MNGNGTPHCPMDSINPSNNMPLSSNEQEFDQKQNLSKNRELSTIPTAEADKNWIYPSEQMFFNAMKKKNWNPNEADMKVVVPIHNAVNEQSWKRILEWESNSKYPS